ncbi:hypothetical protein TMatcc_010565 [Talaromyces marneffei ATCC 18224]|uniref:Serine-rich protein, putative n=2 Tax=Talaromyces marneffei TaxID=37727 RepID=B6QV39_TALMQ|nr:uncharacterized protein EYB26_009657 [Talaromyces marneffei]EEA18891.1 serine-rich protein, putative [Talaromyces marneffei ATCC 18224]KAE8548600.1 hypothetical protein EYB25_008981 [Talaromyces marneffei]QGA21943.1 hypothetical protein EYB26_009657 [Talaromyces marneffei]
MSSRPSASVSPRRRPLHERTPSQTNSGEVSPGRRGKRRDEIDFYSSTPYPTKPAQVLLPCPGIGQDYALHGAYGVSDVSLISTETDHTATGPINVVDHEVEQRHRDVSVTSNTWDFSSSVDLAHSSQVWDNDPKSSQSSFPTPLIPSDDEAFGGEYKDKTVSEFEALEAISRPSHEDGLYSSYISDPSDILRQDDDHATDEDEDTIPLPRPHRTSIKPVLPGSSSPNAPAEDYSSSTENFVTYDHTSSPNVVPIGAPSSPNFVSLGSSSPNLVAYGSSSPVAGGMTKRSDSTSSSSNSLGTVIHHTYNNATGWPPLSEGVSSQPASFTSSPPEQLLRGYQSASSLALSSGETNLSRPRTTSTGSGLSEKSLTDTASALIQYPQIRTPSYASSYAESVASQIRRPARAMSDRSVTRWNPTLSTVPAQSVADTPVGDSEKKQGLGLMNPGKSASTIWPVEENDEHLDSLSNLPRSTLRHIPSSLIGTESRPGSSSSMNGFLNVLPNWVRLYYRGNNGQLVQTNAMSIFESSRPSTAASRPPTPHKYISQNPNPTGGVSRPRNRPSNEKIVPAPLRLVSDHPADPRSHWKPTPEEQRQKEREQIEQSTEAAAADYSARRPFAKASSPHLHPDKCHPNPRYTWVAPSLDSRQEPTLGLRNVQKYAFCLGFAFPLIWLIAAFLPLPPQPSPMDEEQNVVVVAQPGAQYRIEQYEKKRYYNARWWRNVNRVMIPVGIAIMTTIIVLATVGTTIGF